MKPKHISLQEFKDFFVGKLGKRILSPVPIERICLITDAIIFEEGFTYYSLYCYDIENNEKCFVSLLKEQVIELMNGGSLYWFEMI